MDNLKMKNCSKCKSIKDMSFFVGNKGQETKQCKVCRDAGKRHYKKHKEELKIKNKEYRQNYKDKINATARAWGKKKFNCPCGRIISNYHKAEHPYVSMTHILYLQQTDEKKYRECIKKYNERKERIRAMIESQ